MIEPYLLGENVNSTNAQSPHSWQSEYNESITERNDDTIHQLVDSDEDDDDYVQLLSRVRAGPSHRRQTVDLNESIFETAGPSHRTQTVDLNESIFETAGPSHRTQTVNLNESIFEVPNYQFVNDVQSLTNHRTRHTSTTDPPESVALPNHIWQTLPPMTVANFAKEDIRNNTVNDANTSNDRSGVADWMKQVNAVNNHFGNATAAPATSTLSANDWQYWDDCEDIFGVTNVTNLPRQSSPETNNPQAGPSTSDFYEYLPFAGVTNVPVQNAVNNEPNRNHQIPFLGQPPQLVHSFEVPVPPLHQPAEQVAALPLIPQINRANATSIHAQQNQPRSSGMAHQMQQEMINMERALKDAIPRWYQANDEIFPPYAGNGMQPAQTAITGHPVNMSIAPSLNMKRRHTVAIPIKVVRSTKQYETLIEMGFLKKDVEAALRKFNLDLHEAIDYLSGPKHAAKRQKKDQNTRNQFTAEMPSEIQQAYEETNKAIAEPRKPANLYEELLHLEETGGIVKSIESFDCAICMETIEMKDGIMLRNCLHRYCKDCLNGTIVHSDEININCPYVSCEEKLQDREIRAVLLPDEYEKYLMKGVRVAQVTISGTILCNLPDCNGWCICDDEVNEFKCPQCKNINCIPCKAIHPERNCRQYQDDLAAGDVNGIISGQRRSEQAIQELINKNEAMKCFKCGILIMKRDGCDYIECVMCKAGICWATRGPRYGPGGIGDASGGCGCSALQRCHKDCRGCH